MAATPSPRPVAPRHLQVGLGANTQQRAPTVTTYTQPTTVEADDSDTDEEGVDAMEEATAMDRGEQTTSPYDGRGKLEQPAEDEGADPTPQHELVGSPAQMPEATTHTEQRSDELQSTMGDVARTKRKLRIGYITCLLGVPKLGGMATSPLPSRVPHGGEKST